MASRAILRRALLYVPGSNKRMLEKSRGLDVDCITYDLEDSVTLSQKLVARRQIFDILSLPRVPGIREQAVRINAVETGLALEDLTETVCLLLLRLHDSHSPKSQQALGPASTSSPLPRPPAPSANFTSSTFVHGVLSASGKPNIRLIALIESARAVMDIRSICTSTPLLSGLIFAAEDFSLDLSLTRTPSLTEFLFARQTIVAAARAYNLDSAIDLVCTDYKDPSGALTRECEGGAGMGFTGKQCIHPSQVKVVQRLFAPSWERVRDSVRLLCAERIAEEQGKGSWALDGKMIDRPVIEAAKAIVEKAELAGMGVAAMWEEFKDVVPK
ncbi:putative citrate lyase beta subunit [Trichophaea hybrida]|nr:putative citrate lyase beta subunit [Trichophaea hybrida]